MVTFVEAEIPDVMDLNAAVGFPVALYEFVRDLPRYLAENGLALSMNEVLDGIGSPDVRGVVASQLGPEAMPEAVVPPRPSTSTGPGCGAPTRSYFAENAMSMR